MEEIPKLFKEGFSFVGKFRHELFHSIKYRLKTPNTVHFHKQTCYYLAVKTM